MNRKSGTRGIPGGTKVWENGRGNGRGPTRPAIAENGHAFIAEEINIESIMATWLGVCDDVRNDLREKEGRRLYDPRSHQEWQLTLVLDLIHGGFHFEDETDADKLWDYPAFAQEIAKRAGETRLSSEKFMRRAFVPLLEHEEDAGSKAIDFLLGEEFLRRQDVKEILMGLLRDHRKKAKPINQEPEDPLELAIGRERISPA